MKNLAIITARGGSKRIPRKNIKDFLGKPIIKYSIDAAIESGCFDEVIVSTDDEEIANLAIKYGATVPFIRSAKNSDDHSTTAEVLIEVFDKLNAMGKNFDYACCIYPTAPFVTADKLIQSYSKLITSGAKSVVPIVKFGFPILRSFKLDNGMVKMNWPQHLNTRSQDLPTAYHDAGQYYFFRVEPFLKDKKIFTDETIGIEMPESEVQDIDNEEDWKIAEIKYTFLTKKLFNSDL
jgi:N-acylneuraminate cytidylyltransferase